MEFTCLDDLRVLAESPQQWAEFLAWWAVEPAEQRTLKPGDPMPGHTAVFHARGRRVVNSSAAQLHHRTRAAATDGKIPAIKFSACCLNQTEGKNALK